MEVPLFGERIASDERLDATWLGIDPRSFECVPYSEWRDFEVASSRALAAIVVSSEPDPDLESRVRDLSRRIPTGFIWVGVSSDGETPASNMATAVLRWVPGSRNDDSETLGELFHHARTLGFLRRMSWCIHDVRHLHTGLKRYLEIALLHDPPVHTVETLARRAGVTPHRIRYCWGVFATQTRPKEFLQWVLTVHIALRKPFGRSWNWLAAELGVSSQTVRRAVRRTLDGTPAEADEDHGAGVMASFARYMEDGYGVECADWAPSTNMGQSVRK